MVYDKLEELLNKIENNEIEIKRGEKTYTPEYFVNLLKEEIERGGIKRLKKIVDFLSEVLSKYGSFPKSKDIRKVSMMYLLEKALLTKELIGRLNRFQNSLRDFDEKMEELFNNFRRAYLSYILGDTFEEELRSVSNDFIRFLIGIYSLKSCIISEAKKRKSGIKDINLIERNLETFFEELKVSEMLEKSKEIKEIVEILKYIEKKIGKRSFFGRRDFLEVIEDLYYHMLGYLSERAERKIDKYKNLLESLESLFGYLEKIKRCTNIILRNFKEGIDVFNEEYAYLIRMMDRLLRKRGRKLLVDGIIEYDESTKNLLINFLGELDETIGIFKKFKDEFLRRYQAEPEYIIISLSTHKKVISTENLYPPLRKWIRRKLKVIGNGGG